MINIKVLGTGFISDHLPYDKITDRLDLTEQQIESIINYHKPDVLINCIAKTGNPNTDWCETNKEITYKTNTLLPIILATKCAQHSIKFIHIGTGSIYNGHSNNWKYDENFNQYDNGFLETDVAYPISYYERTKYIADKELSKYNNVSIFRIKLPISNIKHSKNLLTKLLTFNKVINSINSITFLEDFVKWTDYFITNNISPGIYHVVNPNPTTYIDILKEYQIYRPEHSFEIIDQDSLNQLTTAKRSNCILNIDKLLLTGFKIRDTNTAIKETIKQYIGD